MYRYSLRESCSQFDSLPVTSLTIPPTRKVERGDLGVTFVNIDQTLDNSTGRSATTCSAPVAKALEETLSSRGATPLRQVAALQAAIAADAVTILHADGCTTIQLADFPADGGGADGGVDGGAVDTRRIRMASAVREALVAVAPAVRPDYGAARRIAEGLAAERGKPARCVVFGGELESLAAIRAAFPGPRRGRRDAPRGGARAGAADDCASDDVTFVNLRDHRNVAEKRAVPGELRSSLFVVAGTECLADVLARQFAPLPIAGAADGGEGERAMEVDL